MATMPSAWFEAQLSEMADQIRKQNIKPVLRVNTNLGRLPMKKKIQTMNASTVATRLKREVMTAGINPEGSKRTKIVKYIAHTGLRMHINNK